MPKLILVKHAKPQMDESVPSHAWGLSDVGRASCGPLAERLRPLGVQQIVTSEEPKAAETGRLVAAALGVACEAAAGLQEHDRSNVPVLPTREFIASIALLFNRPTQLVLGLETGAKALKRFERAVFDAVDRHPDQTLAVVTHGTVMALFAEAYGGADPFPFWRRMQLPSFVVFSRPDLEIVETVEAV
jgi:broad specificity phosphatase PhoE